jgi:hypothetical protein
LIAYQSYRGVRGTRELAMRTITIRVRAVDFAERIAAMRIWPRQVEWLPRVEGEEVRFASDSPLEESGFQPSVQPALVFSFDPVQLVPARRATRAHGPARCEVAVALSSLLHDGYELCRRRS